MVTTWERHWWRSSVGPGRARLRVLAARHLPVNDGGIASGQAAIAAAAGTQNP